MPRGCCYAAMPMPIICAMFFDMAAFAAAALYAMMF